jgi:hypothetical protein
MFVGKSSGVTKNTMSKVPEAPNIPTIAMTTDIVFKPEMSEKKPAYDCILILSELN